MKLLSILGLGLLLALPALGSPVTTDAIYGQNGLTLYVGPAVLAMPSDVGSASMLSTVNSATVQNKTFDASSNIEKQFKYTYDFAVLGGATGVVSLKGVPMPTGAIIKNVVIATVTAPTSGAAASGATMILTAVNAGDLMAITGATGFHTTYPMQGIPNNLAGVSGNMITPTQWGTGLIPTLTIGASNLTAGKINVYIDTLINN